eukprot:364263-Chlamydomonas_euryale.AAC.14
MPWMPGMRRPMETLLDGLRVGLHAVVRAHALAGTHVRENLHACTGDNMHACNHARMHACFHTLMHPRMHASMRTQVRAC